MHLSAIEQLKVLAAKKLMMEWKTYPPQSLYEFEFQVFSQWGDDGIIQWLIHLLASQLSRTFIEFGVEDYTELQTRFLVANNDWQGLVMDGTAHNIHTLMKSDLFWAHDLKAVATFITAENINDLIQSQGISGEIGLLVIDIDGNDYWVWRAIDCIQPSLVVVEYNSVFGRDHALTIPYDPGFVRTAAHYSNLYFGCSLKAIAHLANDKGYALIGSNSAGNNAFFLRKDLLFDLSNQRLNQKCYVPVEVSVDEAYVYSRFRESIDEHGSPTFLAGRSRSTLIAHMPVYDIETDTIQALGKYLD